MRLINYFTYLKTDIIALYINLHKLNKTLDENTMHNKGRYLKFLNKRYYLRYWFISFLHRERFEYLFNEINLKLKKCN